LNAKQEKVKTYSVLSALNQFTSFARNLWHQIKAHPRPEFFAIRNVARNVTVNNLKADFLAGINVALLAFPMSMAFAMKAGLPVWCGLVGCGVAAFVVPIFTGSANLSAGPTNASAALLLGTFASLGAISPDLRAEVLPTLVLMTGIFLLLASWLRLSGFADFVPRTVISAYIAAAALRVIALQLPITVGLPDEISGQNLVEVIWQILRSGKAILNPGLGLAINHGHYLLCAKKTLWNRQSHSRCSGRRNLWSNHYSKRDISSGQQPRNYSLCR
jgi:hypothetical protein